MKVNRCSMARNHRCSMPVSPHLLHKQCQSVKCIISDISHVGQQPIHTSVICSQGSWCLWWHHHQQHNEQKHWQFWAYDYKHDSHTDNNRVNKQTFMNCIFAWWLWNLIFKDAQPTSWIPQLQMSFWSSSAAAPQTLSRPIAHAVPHVHGASLEPAPFENASPLVLHIQPARPPWLFFVSDDVEKPAADGIKLGTEQFEDGAPPFCCHEHSQVLTVPKLKFVQTVMWYRSDCLQLVKYNSDIGYNIWIVV